jgi:hypothetical protein
LPISGLHRFHFDAEDRNATAAQREGRATYRMLAIRDREQISKQPRFEVAPQLLGSWLVSEYG